MGLQGQKTSPIRHNALGGMGQARGVSMMMGGLGHTSHQSHQHHQSHLMLNLQGGSSAGSRALPVNTGTARFPLNMGLVVNTQPSSISHRQHLNKRGMPNMVSNRSSRQSIQLGAEQPPDTPKSQEGFSDEERE